MKIQLKIHKPKIEKTRQVGVTPGLGWACLVRTCETEAGAMPELTIGPATWTLWACEVHAGVLEDSLAELLEK